LRLGEVRSSGGIFDPYVYRGTGGQGLPPMMTKDGVKTRWGIMRSHLKSGMCAGIIQVHAFLVNGVVSLGRATNLERNACSHLSNEPVPSCARLESAKTTPTHNPHNLPRRLVFFSSSMCTRKFINKISTMDRIVNATPPARINQTPRPLGAQKHVPEFHASKFPPVANEVFKEFFEAHRKGDMRALAGLTTEELYATLKVARSARAFCGPNVMLLYPLPSPPLIVFRV